MRKNFVYEVMRKSTTPHGTVRTEMQYNLLQAIVLCFFAMMVEAKKYYVRSISDVNRSTFFTPLMSSGRVFYVSRCLHWNVLMLRACFIED